MEADWEVEIGADAPIIDACWEGFVDLRVDPRSDPRTPSEAYRKRARGLAEAANLSGLAEALVRLNGPQSPVWTSKCDVWPVLDANAFDAGELDAPWDEATHAWACYVDLLPKSDRQWITPAMAVDWCKTWCERLGAVPLTHCRADLIVRQAIIAPELMDRGITAYLTACGPSSESANAALARALKAFAHTISSDSPVE
jgi:hypothetical protein